VSPACRKSIYRCTSGGKRLHVQIAAAALGRTLPRGAEVHHVNGDKWDNRHSNLVICQDRAYHALLHRNLRILRAGGDPFRDSHCSLGNHLAPIERFYRRKKASSGKQAGALTTVCVDCNRERYADPRDAREDRR
jgi:hypothetical protein